MKCCCLNEISRTLKRQYDVATCDDCGALLLAYSNDTEFFHSIKELKIHNVEFTTTTLKKLKIIAKPKP